MRGFHAHSNVLLQQCWLNDLEALRSRLRCCSMILNGICLRSHLNSSGICFCLIAPKHLALFCGTDFKFLDYFNEVFLVQLSISDPNICWPYSPRRVHLIFSVLLLYRPLPQPNCSDFHALQKKPLMRLYSDGHIISFGISFRRPCSRSISCLKIRLFCDELGGARPL